MADAAMVHAVLSRALKMVLDDFQPSITMLLDGSLQLSSVTHEVLLNLRDGRSLTLRMEADIQPRDATAEGSRIKLRTVADAVGSEGEG